MVASCALYECLFNIASGFRMQCFFVYIDVSVDDRRVLHMRAGFVKRKQEEPKRAWITLENGV